ncbi:hypothetical protein [Arthrobacter zhaoxinii]|uniref:hypothetical protein n=1 Tax=Arthrobacter zhaoxinii TaxID=2964616 RepID=UPI00210814D4|nr:hypothetical protein [Arthrobacter zhaoxinii]MCQ2000378.1 hypothetical protein [Arthrobacter zhaoxinii]
MQHKKGALSHETNVSERRESIQNGPDQGLSVPTSLENSMRVAIESQLLSMGVLLERTTEAMEQQSGQFRAALSALEQRNQRLQTLLDERDESLRQATREIKRLTVTRGAIARDAERLRDELAQLQASLSMRVGSHIVRSIENPSSSWKLVPSLPRTVLREIMSRRVK